MPNVKKGGTTLCRTPFPTSVFPCQIASLQGGTTLCRTPPSPHPFFPAGLPLCRGCDTVSDVYKRQHVHCMCHLSCAETKQQWVVGLDRQPLDVYKRQDVNFSRNTRSAYDIDVVPDGLDGRRTVKVAISAEDRVYDGTERCV